MPKAAPSPGKKHPSPRFNSMAVKDGRLLKGPPGQASQKAQKRTFCRTETAWHYGGDRAFKKIFRAAARSHGIRSASERTKKQQPAREKASPATF